MTMQRFDPNAPVRYGASFASTGQLSSGAAQEVVAPAANTKGITVWMAEYIHIGTGTPGWPSLLAKASAPTTVIDGDVLPMAATVFENPSLTILGACGNLVRPVFIPAGKGLYWRTMANETNSQVKRSVLYTIH